MICKVLWLLRASGEKYLGFVWQIRCNLRHLARLHKDAFWKYFFRWKFSKIMLHSVLERIWIKGSYLSQWLPQGERGPLRSQNHDELKSSTVGPNLLNDFWKSKNFKKFRITLKFFFALQYIKNWIKVVPWKIFFCSWKNNC